MSDFSLFQECATFGIRVLVEMEDALLQSYIHDFVFKNLLIDIKQHSFISHLMVTIKDHGANRCRGVKGVAYELLALHFQYKVHQNLINRTSTVLRLLNGIDSLFEYDSQRWIKLGVSSPIDFLTESNFETLCQYLLTTLYSAFHIAIQNCQTQRGSFDSWNNLYTIMVSFF
jgi:hypothetical protein